MLWIHRTSVRTYLLSLVRFERQDGKTSKKGMIGLAHEVPYYMQTAKEVTFLGKEALKKALMDLNASTCFEQQGNELEVFHVKCITSQGYYGLSVGRLGQKQSLYETIPFSLISEDYRAEIERSGFLLISGYYFYIVSPVCITQLSKMLSLGSGGDAFKNNWLECHLLLQRAIMESKKHWCAVIRSDGTVNRMTSILSRNSPHHTYAFLLELMDELPGSVYGTCTEHKVSITIQSKDVLIQLMDSVTGQGSFSIKTDRGYAFTRDHRTELSIQEQTEIKESLFQLIGRDNRKRLSQM